MPDSEQDKGIEEEQVEDLDEAKAEGESEDDVEGYAFDAFKKIQPISGAGAAKWQPQTVQPDIGGLNFDKH